MTDFVQANSVGIQAAYSRSNYTEADTVGVQVAYWLTAPFGYVEADSVGVQIAYRYLPFNANRVFPVALSRRLLQSQSWRRSFPL